jgi:hypothetical protein
MLGWKYIKRKLVSKDKEVPANEQFYSPLRIALHSTINVSMIDWFAAIPELHKALVMPHGSMSVLAIGTVDVDREKIFNIYMMDTKLEEFILQLYCSPNNMGQGMEVREATLYRQVAGATPQTEDEWTVEMYSVGDPEISLDDKVYNRIWSENSAGKVDLVTFEEDVIRMEETLHYTNNYMLYGRDIDAVTPMTELLLVGVEESDDTAELVYSIGLTVPLSAIKVQ